MKNKNQRSGLLWGIYLRPHLKQYLVVLTSLILNIIPSLVLTLLLGYGIKTLQKGVEVMTWIDFVGEHASRWLKPLVRGTVFEGGIPIDIQTQWFAPLLAATALASLIFKFTQEYLIEDLGEKVARNLRIEVFSHFLNQPFRQSSGVNEGLLSSMVGEDAREVRQTFTRLFASVISDALHCVLYIGILALLDTQLFVLFVSILLPAGIVIRVTGKKLKRLAKQGLSFESELLGALLERFRGWQTIKAFKAQDFELKRFSATNTLLFHTWRRSARAKSLSTPLVEWLGALAAALVIVLALRRIAEDALSSNVLATFLAAIAQLATAGQNLSTQLNSVRKGTAALQRMHEFLQSTPTAIQPQTLPSSRVASNVLKSIELQKLVLADYDGLVPLIKPLSLQLKEGDFLVITGPSGTGKSTLLRALLGLEKPLAGTMLFDGQTLAEQDYVLLAKQIVFIPQDPFIFEGTLFENIIYPERFENPDQRTRERAGEALALAKLEKNLYAGISGLSGGERQRLMFARAFFHNARLWIIDEGTSALDEKTEISLLTELSLKSKDKIIISVAHRPQIKQFATQAVELTPS